MLKLILSLLVLLPLMKAGEVEYISVKTLENPEFAVFKDRLVKGQKSGMIYSDIKPECLSVQGELVYVGRARPWERNLAERWAGWMIGRVLAKSLPIEDVEGVFYQFVPQTTHRSVEWPPSPISVLPYLEAMFSGRVCVAKHPKQVCFVQFRFHQVIP